jgi:hypothetical protein
MSNEEQTQIFRGDDLPPERAIAETGGPAKRKRQDAPSDQRSLRDQEDGPSDTRQLRDNRDELADLRLLHDAQGAAELRKTEDGDGPSDQRSLRDAEGIVDSRHAQDGEGPSELRSMRDGDGMIDTRHANDADGPSILREMHDAAHAPGGPGELGSHQFHGDAKTDAGDDQATLHSSGDEVEREPAIDEAALAKAAQAQSDADLTFKVDDDATPWALSIHLEARIASLSESTAKVNEQLGGLEDATRRLAKRIGK